MTAVDKALADLAADTYFDAHAHRCNIAAAFDFLAAVIDARFATIRAGLDMTREVI